MTWASINPTEAVPPSTHPSDAHTACLASAYKALKKRFSHLLQKNDSLAKKNKSLQQQLDQTLRDNFQIRGELQRLHETYNILAKDIARIKVEKAQLFERLENERFQRELSDLILNQYKDEVKERKEEIEREVFKRELSDLLLDQYRNRIEEQDKALKEKDFDVALSKESVTAAYSEISALSSQVLYWKQEVAINEGHISSLAHKLEGNTGQMTRQNNQIANLEKERREAMDGCRYFEGQIKRLKATYDELLIRVDALNSGCDVGKQTE
ncbi:hypothetical protein FIE12Z_4322 [Fusarium flagelliforme]|uniref:Uncharacterized protein n=1 Tax=Fusarium flagelliforme TaxID=2675880 RepID=A0A395MTY7_9HYPO|nr:hypothetical protein FIE12Z_4322 [Fusarium flagelliforme]